MTIIIFLIILNLLIVVHELGHFLFARYFGVRVDEFGVGLPPRALRLFNFRGTEFTLNWIPFGGFVKIFGEDRAEEELENSEKESFQSKNRGAQASILFGGVLFNFLLAWGLISLGYLSGLPSAVSPNLPAEDRRVVVTAVLPGTPAELAGLSQGDEIKSLSRGEEIFYPELERRDFSTRELAGFISSSAENLKVVVEREGEVREFVVAPREGVIGIAMELIGTVKAPAHLALFYGWQTTVESTKLVASGLLTFIKEALLGRADFSTITGPVGIAGMVGSASSLGLSYLLVFTAFLSINLAVINLLPIPALDGGRLVFVAIEALIRRPISAKVSNALNSLGFTLLIALLVVVTFKDILSLF